jgi:hypothetical protein
MALAGSIARAVELCSGIDALYLSAQGEAPATLLEALADLQTKAEETDLPTEASLGGYPVKVLPRAWGKYKYCAVHELARIGFTPSAKLPVVRFQPTAVALHSLGPHGTVLGPGTLSTPAGSMRVCMLLGSTCTVTGKAPTFVPTSGRIS